MRAEHHADAYFCTSLSEKIQATLPQECRNKRKKKPTRQLTRTQCSHRRKKAIKQPSHLPKAGPQKVTPDCVRNIFAHRATKCDLLMTSRCCLGEGLWVFVIYDGSLRKADFRECNFRWKWRFTTCNLSTRPHHCMSAGKINSREITESSV